MDWITVTENITRVLHIIASLVLISVVLLQSGKVAGLSGSIAGGAETFFGKNKGRTIDAKLEKWTSFFAIVFLITCMILGLMLSRFRLDAQKQNNAILPQDATQQTGEMPNLEDITGATAAPDVTATPDTTPTATPAQ